MGFSPACHSIDGKDSTTYHISYEARFSDFCASHFPGDFRERRARCLFDLFASIPIKPLTE